MVARPMHIRQNTSIFLRPTRSPKWPITTPPSGRAMNPTANVENAASCPAKSEKLGKNSGPNTSAAAEA